MCTVGGMVTSRYACLVEHLGGQSDLLHNSRGSGLAMYINLGLGAVN